MGVLAYVRELALAYFSGHFQAGPGSELVDVQHNAITLICIILLVIKGALDLLEGL